MLISMLEYDDDDELIRSSLIPLIDGGTEGFKGNEKNTIFWRIFYKFNIINFGLVEFNFLFTEK